MELPINEEVPGHPEQLSAVPSVSVIIPSFRGGKFLARPSPPCNRRR